jgi:16S rRNA (guanine(966)-N(2))-methyltransferase RsmD
VRIISGIYKGKVIDPGKGFEARPTTDFAKESLFNILANRIDFEEVEVLDLFAGTGSISFEFASRGSKHIEAIESNHKHAAFIQKTAQTLKFTQMRAYKTNVFVFLKTCSHKYDVIFADPPYDMEGVAELPDLILEKNILKEDGIFILEHSKKLNFSKHPNLTEHRNYGSVNFSFFAVEKKV